MVASRRPRAFARCEAADRWQQRRGARLGLDEGFALIQSDSDLLLGSDEEHAARGPLSFDPQGGLSLRLWGVSEAVFEAEPDQFTLLGRSSKGRPCSLVDCFSINTTRHFPVGFSERQIRANVLVHGAHVPDLEAFQFDQAELEIPGLREFLSVGSGLDRNDSRQVALEGGTIEFVPTLSVSNPTSTSRVETGGAIARFALDEPLNYGEWQDRWAKPLARLVVLATGEPTRITSFRAIVDVDQPDEPRTTEVDFVTRPPELIRELNFRRDRLLLSLGSLGEDFDAVVSRWWGVHDMLGGAPDFLFGVLTTKLPIELRLVTSAAVAEAYHRIRFPDELAVEPRRHELLRSKMAGLVDSPPEREHYLRRLGFANELSQSERLVKLLRRAGKVVPPLGRKAGRLAEVLSATRNYVAHLPVDRRENVLESSEMYEATQLLLLAVQCNLLLDLGIENEDAERMFARRFGGAIYFQNLAKRGSSWPKG